MSFFSSLSRNAREYRHSPCVMRPLVALLFLFGGLLSLLLAIWKLPTMLLGLFLVPLFTRFSWLVEFLYPLSIGRSLHIWGLQWGARRQNNSPAHPNCHSRCAETRIQVVPHRVFIHPLPQLLDNIGYLVVCLPEAPPGSNTPLGTVTVQDDSAKIVAFLVDVGDATAVKSQISMVEREFYDSRRIDVRSILSTHKHHDHTAGNIAFLKSNYVQEIIGGAIEQVPGCTTPVVNGTTIKLPSSGSNRMADVVSVTCIATPAHTRGSMTYMLRSDSGCCCLFTGDTIFSGGAGVAFEADVTSVDESKMTANKYIQASAAAYAVERCFAEVLFRIVGFPSSQELLIFPGHEYTAELLGRQLTQQQQQLSCRWKNLVPAAFFDTAAHWYVMHHRRTLPANNGRLMTVPSSLERELTINPHFRSLRLRGETVVNALQLWYTKFATEAVAVDAGPAFPVPPVATPSRPASNQQQWTLTAKDMNRSIFTTVYASDLDQVIDDLRLGRVEPESAANRLQELKGALQKQVIGRRPIPGTIPSSRAVYRGLLGFVLLASAPVALCPSDSEKMNLPEPMEPSETDRIEIDQKRLISVLHWLGLLNENNGKELVAIIRLLWKETDAYIQKCAGVKRYQSDMESAPTARDQVHLGALKWVIYGIPEQRLSSKLSYCMPCLATDDDMPKHPHMAVHYSRQSGELVRHDIYSCKLCRDATGCAAVQVQEVNADTERPVVQTISSVSRCNPPDINEDEGSDHEDAFIEVTAEIHGSVVEET